MALKTVSGAWSDITLGLTAESAERGLKCYTPDMHSGSPVPLLPEAVPRPAGIVVCLSVCVF